MSRSADELFEQFQRSGSPLALAQVFDLLAPQLLLLAGHLVRDTATAEDVVQNTFLDAIEVAPRFDPRLGSVQRWLVGILVNNARKELRRRSRALDPARLVPEPTGHPEVEAAAHEFLQTVERALGEMPAHYRDVLRLGLLHGLDQQEIAMSLDRPRETVKTQFRRGVDQLRALLPKGFALSVALAFTMGRGMAGVRSAVLRRVDSLPAPVGAGAAVSAAGGTGTAARSALLIPALLVGLGTALAVSSTWGLWPRGPAERASQSAVIASQATAPTDVASPGSPREPSDGPAPGSLTVRAAWERDGQPAAIGVRIRPEGDDSWHRELWLATDSAGLLTCRPPVPGRWRVRGDRGGETVVEVDPRHAASAELVVPPGLLVEGQVVDPTQQPVAGAEVWLARAEGDLDECSHVATTDDRGRFRLADVEASHVLGVRAEGWVLPQAQALVDLGGGRTQVHFELTTRAAGVAGLVLGVDGRPAADALVMAGYGVRSEELGRPLRIPWRLRTDAHGRFRLAGVPRNGAVALWTRGEGSAVDCRYFVQAEMNGPIEVRLVAGTRVKGQIKGPSGEPIAGGEVTVVHFPSEKIVQDGFVFPKWGRITEVAADPEGRFVLHHVPPGDVELAALHDQGLARSRVVFTGDPEHWWDAVLEAPADLRILVVDEQGEPLPGFVAEVRTMQLEQLIWRGRANERGGMRCPNIRREPYQLVVLDPVSAVGMAVPAARVGPVVAGPKVHRVVVPAAQRATAFVTLRPRAVHGAVLRNVFLAFARQEDRSVRIGEVPSVWAEDQLRLGPLPAGRWQFVVGVEGLGSQHVGPVDLAPGESRDLGDVQFQEAGQLVVELVVAPGRALANKVLSVVRPEAPFVTESLALDQGRGSLRLQPGRYYLSPWSHELPMSYQEFTIEAGGRHRIQVHAPPVVNLTLEWPETAEPFLFVELSCFDAAGRQLLRMPCTRRSGVPARMIYCAEPGRYTLVARDLLGREQRQEFTVPGAGGEPASVRVPVPPPR